MFCTDLKSVLYIMDENEGIGGKIAFKYLQNIISIHEDVTLILSGPNLSSEIINSVLNMSNKSYKINDSPNEKKFDLINLSIKNNLLENLCMIGKYPNVATIECKNGWVMEYNDEFFKFKFSSKKFNENLIQKIENELLGDGIFFERRLINRF